MAKKQSATAGTEYKGLNLRRTTHKERVFLGQFGDRMREEDEAVTDKAVFAAKKIALARFRASAESLESIANTLATEMLQEEEEEGEE